MSESQPLEPSASTAQRGSKADENGQVPETLPWRAAVELVRGASKILLICHISPDGDAIGSLLGLGLALHTLGKTPTLACESTPPSKFSFLSGFESIVSRVDPLPFDLVIALDSSDLTRLGEVYNIHHVAGVPLINIDHHVTNLYFGEVNLVDPNAASTAELVLTLLDHLGISIDQKPWSDPTSSLQSNQRGLPTPARTAVSLWRGTTSEGARDGSQIIYATDDTMREIATCLLLGIVTDTLGFRTSNVTPRVMASALRLMEAGASLSRVTHFAFNQRPVVELCLLAHGLGRMQTDRGLGWSEIRLADRRDCGYVGTGDAGLVGMLARTREIQMAVVFSEREDNQVEIGFRADPGFDVAQLALSLGGGGHPAASGCTIEGTLESARARVLPMMRAALEEQRKSRQL